MCGVASPPARVHGSSNEGEEMKQHLSLVSTSKLFASHPCNLLLCWSTGLHSKGRDGLTRRHNTDSTELEVRLPPGHFGLLRPLNQKAKKGAIVLAEVIDSDYKGEIGVLLWR